MTGAANRVPEREPAAVDGAAPDWFDEAKVTLTIDADASLAAGQVPLPRVITRCWNCPPGALLFIKSAFRPAPLLEALHKAGHRTYVRQTGPDAFHTFVCPKASA